MNTMKIMLADADDDFRSLLAEAITRENDLEVCGNTGDGEEALRLLDELQPDVLLMDLVTSRIDGLELLRRINGKEGKRPTILVLSGFIRGGVVNQAAELGADYFNDEALPYRRSHGTYASVTAGRSIAAGKVSEP